MKVFRSIGKVFKPLVNFPLWLGWKQISSATKDLKETAEYVFNKSESKTKKREETFEQAAYRLRLDDQAIEQRAMNFLRLAIFYLVFAAGLFIYAIYLFIETSHVLGTAMSLVLSTVLLVYAYREHFWYFQLKKRKFGCTFKEWIAFTFKGAK
jgi:intracellular multiplication protein IcmV